MSEGSQGSNAESSVDDGDDIQNAIAESLLAGQSSTEKTPPPHVKVPSSVPGNPKPPEPHGHVSPEIVVPPPAAQEQDFEDFDDDEVARAIALSLL